jgi:hypothetical protein
MEMIGIRYDMDLKGPGAVVPHAELVASQDLPTLPTVLQQQGACVCSPRTNCSPNSASHLAKYQIPCRERGKIAREAIGAFPADDAGLCYGIHEGASGRKDQSESWRMRRSPWRGAFDITMQTWV